MEIRLRSRGIGGPTHFGRGVEQCWVVLSALALTLLYASPAMGAVRTFGCSQNASFTVQLKDGAALVQLDGRKYRLNRKPSFIGVRYGSADAALMIDGRFASFVTDRGPMVSRCYEVESIAKGSRRGGRRV